MPGQGGFAQDLQKVRSQRPTREVQPGDIPPSLDALSQPPPSGQSDQPQTLTPTQPGGDSTIGGDVVQAIKELLTGVGMGAGETAIGLSDLSRDIFPFLNRVMPREDYTKHFTTEPRTDLETVGKFGEQVGEFFLPVTKAAKMKTIGGLVRAIPNNFSPKNMKLANKAAALVGRSAAEGGMAAGLSALHGDQNAAPEGVIAGLAPLLGSAVGSGANILKSPVVSGQILPLILGTLMAKTAGGLSSETGLGSGLATFGVSRALARRYLQNPNAVKALQKAAAAGSVTAGRLLAALQAELGIGEPEPGQGPSGGLP